MKSFAQYKNLISATQMLSSADIKGLCIFLNKNHKQAAIKEWMQSEFQECTLPLKDIYNHLHMLLLSYEGKGGKIRTNSPLSPEDWYQVRHANNVLFVGMYNTLDAGELSISVPLYQIVYNQNVKGFKYYISCGKPVTLK